MKFWGRKRSHSTAVVLSEPVTTFEPLPERVDRAVAGNPSRRSMPSIRMAFDSMGRLEGRVPTTPDHPDWKIASEWSRLVARSRYTVATNTYAQKFLSLIEDNVPGTNGFQFQAQTPKRRGKGTDIKLNQALEDAYAEFSRAENFDARGNLSRVQFERLAARTVATDGECLAVAIYGDAAGPYGFAYRLVDPTLLEVDYNKELVHGGNYIKHGVEFTRSGRRVAYHFRQPEESQLGYMVNDRYHTRLRVPAEDVDHLYLPWAIGAERGMPWMRATTSSMVQMTAYEEAAVTRARVSASECGFIQATGDEISPDPDDDITDYEIDLEPGVLRHLPPGWEAKAFNSAYPAGEFQVFTKAMLRSIASALGVSYVSLANDLEGVNFSSIRQGVLDEREHYKALQAWMISRLCLRQYERWLKYALLSGRIAGASILDLDRCRRVQFIGRRWDWVDPLKDISATEKEIELGLRSRTATMRERGRDPENTWKEIQQEREQMAALGISPQPEPEAEAPQQTQSEQDEA